MALELRFDSGQNHQLEAIEATSSIFEGQPYIEPDFKIMQMGGFGIMGNRLDLDAAQLLENVQAVQRSNELPVVEVLQTIEAEIETEVGKRGVQFPNFSIEMETGTGKTYVYIRTALELARRYGFRKYIIVVPRVAIREGVLKTFEITRSHFAALFSNMPYRFKVYDSGSLSRLKQFAESNVVEFLIMTIDSFNKDANVIRQTSRDGMNNVPPLYLIQNARPILILDEPQLMGSELSVKALASLNPLLALRYSATHRRGEEYNMVYRLTPFEAYRRGLVKQIEVAGLQRVDDANQPFMRLEEVTSEKRTFKARLTVHVLSKSGTISEKTITVSPRDLLVNKTGLPEYAAYEFEEFRTDEQAIYFTSGKSIRKGETLGADKDRMFEAQIRYTIEQHFKRQKRLLEKDIKVLSLFFIDRVDNYVRPDGVIRRLFTQAFNDIKQKYAEWRDVDVEAVQGWYFAQKRTRTGEVIYEESKTGESERDKEAYDLILRDKETLLTLPTPADDSDTRRKRQVCFIFSHSALREGWDNPNIFQICTLNQASSEMRKRQEIGRGVRLAVNQQGERLFDHDVNVLTVVANQNYEAYVSQYQSEVEAEYGRDGAPPKPLNARTRSVARRRDTKEHFLSEEFRELWERIKHKTRYNVKVDTEQLVTEAIAELNNVTISPPRIEVVKARVDVEHDATGDKFVTSVMGQSSIAQMPVQTRKGQSIIDMMAHMLQFTSPPVRLTRKTLIRVVLGLDAKQREAALANPQEFASIAVRVLKSRLADQFVDGIQYERIDDYYEVTQFAVEIESWEEYLIPAGKSLYDYVITDDSTPERQFVQDLENWEEVKLFVKLPGWFVVPTPIGNYNPDWAVVIQPHDEFGQPTGEEMLYLVAETKSTTDLGKLRPDERRKIACGEKHFNSALGVMYKHVVQARQLRED